MKTRIEIVNDRIVRQGLSEVMNNLPEWRRLRAESFRTAEDQYLCGRSFLILQDLLREEYGIRFIPEFSYGIHGKPYMNQYPEVHFNISHCKKGIAVTIADIPIGIDIEEFQFDQETARSAMSSAEYVEIINAARQEETFAAYWTRKESFLKLMGNGLHGDLSMIPGPHTDEVIFKTEINIDAGFAVTTAIWADTHHIRKDSI